MITIRKANDRGHVNHRWLDSKHTFSFGSYNDPRYMGYSALRVINEDKVKKSNGFGEHPHRNMEILSYVISGELKHWDSMGNGSVIKAGEFQLISAGSGITHSEFNPSKDADTHFYQIWIIPNKNGLKPTYQQRQFNFSSETELQLIASNNKEDSALFINQDAKVYKANIEAKKNMALPIEEDRSYWLQVVKGSLELDGNVLTSGDGASFNKLESNTILAKEILEILFFDLP